MVSLSLVWVWRNESERVSPSAVAVCKLLELKRIERAAILTQQPTRTGRKWTPNLRAVFNGTCDPASNCVQRQPQRPVSGRQHRSGRDYPRLGKHGEHSLNRDRLMRR